MKNFREFGGFWSWLRLRIAEIRQDKNKKEKLNEIHFEWVRIPLKREFETLKFFLQIFSNW